MPATAPASAPAPRLLVVHHSPTAAVADLTGAVLAGAHDAEVQAAGPVEVVALEALAFARGEADHDALLGADGYVLLTPANFGYMSGALKHFDESGNTSTRKTHRPKRFEHLF